MKNSKMRIYILLLLPFVLLLQSCGGDDCIEGDGTSNDYTLDVGSFDKISVSGDVDVQITQGSMQSAIIRVEPEIFAVMENKVNSQELQIGFKNNVCVNPAVQIVLMVTTPEISRIEVSGKGDISTVGTFVFEELTIDVSGESQIRLEGSAEVQNFDISGMVEANNFDLQSLDTKIDLSGAGEFELNCTDNLDLKVSGSATIKYIGQPSISQDVSGSVQLIDAN
ncbi:MAG: DUF2807 domain-containing protein [Cyclobacteriaceae bacterium]